ncbi:MAG: acetyl-CoA carboxylase biotin carboxyl carrier protein subunit [Bacteroidetes bacterium]|nr:acetyl-CoA carboxylase biotin carboxyl carrier protein subunit [Bacteroidota bacterium]
MKVDIQNRSITLVKKNNHWVTANAEDVAFIFQDANTLLVQSPSQTIELRCLGIDRQAKTVRLQYKNQNYVAAITEPMDELLKTMGLENALQSKISLLKAPMPGLVLDILVVPGQQVELGEKLLILEAMKMENAIKSPTAGVVASIEICKGQAVDKNLVLIRFE